MKILIVDDEEDIAEMIEFLVKDYFPNNTLVTTAKSGNAAIKILSENFGIDLCICDHNMPNGLGSEVLKYILKQELDTKFVLCSTVTPGERPEDYKEDTVFFSIRKPDVGNGIEKLFKLLEKNCVDKNSICSGNFVPISVHVLALLGRTPVDVYIRMSENKFIKCMRKSDEFTILDKEKYIEKSIQELFIIKDQQGNLINDAVLATTQKILERRNMPLSEKISITHSQLMGPIKHSGMTPELAAASKKMIQQSVNLIMNSPVISEFWKEMNLLGEFPSRLYTLHSMLAYGVLKKLKMDSEATVFKLMLSAYLQDITLDSIPLMEICDYKEFLEKKSQFTSAEVQKFHNHPVKAAEIISHFKDLPHDILRIILEQHEMPDGSGIPLRLKANQVEPVSCVFIITGIFARHLLLEGEGFDMRSFIAYLEKGGYSQGNFKEALNAIKSMQSSIVF